MVQETTKDAKKSSPKRTRAAVSGASGSGAEKKKKSTKKVATSVVTLEQVLAPDEPYMSKKHLQYFRQFFIDWSIQIIRSNESLIDSMKDNVETTPDDNDRASKESEFGVVLRGKDRERRLMSKIESAIRRIDEEDFGYCEECSEAIGLNRLLARPVATLCIECKNLQEEFEKSSGVF